MHYFKQAIYIKRTVKILQDKTIGEYWTSLQNLELCLFVFPKTSNANISTIAAQVCASS